jgi:hypothetical protein
MELEGCNVVVLDLETLRSADDCRHCHRPKDLHEPGLGHCDSALASPQFSPLGWDNKPALGLSIGCWWDYADSRVQYFDRHTLEGTMVAFVDRACLFVSFNGISFDFPLMRGLLRQEADALRLSESDSDLFRSGVLVELCDRFKDLCAVSYDVLAEIWRVDPQRKFERGLNSLDAIAQANGLGAKAMTGAIAPRLWAEGRYAEVLTYCASDVHKTRWLFETICQGKPILRGDGIPIVLPPPPGLDALKSL